VTDSTAFVTEPSASMVLSSLQWLVVPQHSRMCLFGVDLPVSRAVLSVWWVLVPDERGVCFMDVLHGCFFLVVHENNWWLW